MKFGKEFTSQMVPEWHEAYMNYDYLKTLLKDIIRFKRKNNPHHHGHGHHHQLRGTLTLYRSFSGLLAKSGRRRHHHGGGQIGHLSDSDDDIEEGLRSAPILVHSASHGYETTFLMAAEEGGEYETLFFRRLDDEFNKVDRFYKEKVEEVVKEAVMLNKQMDALIAFRVKVEHPDGWPWEERTVEMTQLASDVASSAAAVTASTPARARSESARHASSASTRSPPHRTTAEPSHRQTLFTGALILQSLRVTIALHGRSVFMPERSSF
ncbi:hypothetical protein F2Q68_00036175 [Brassica cretica]|uniref:SPX domain-containing protein n=1 Tax=Brassica cretica TaxID=69181 RepID=A0A8S9H5I6_BRACR|nr:hypothetical protein F2Q68_00036175 [Brassica cretica]